MRRIQQIAAVLITAVVLAEMASYSAFGQAASQPAEPALKGAIQVDGSTTVGPIADEFVAAFKTLHPDVKFTVSKTGSGDGAAALIDGRCQIAMMSRFMKPEEIKKAVEKGVTPVAHAIAMDGVCVITHPSNPVKGLTIQQIRDVYTGKTTNWKDLGGTDMPIVVISRDTSSGTYEAFNHFVMGKEKMFDKVEYVNANPQAHARVASTPGAISYVGLAFVDEKVKAFEVKGILPTRKTVASGQYPLSRPLFLFTNGYPELGSSVHAFCTFYLSERGQEIIEAKGYVPMTSY